MAVVKHWNGKIAREFILADSTISPTCATNLYPRFDTVSMYLRLCDSPSRILRSIEIVTVRLLSSTKLLAQALVINSDFSTRRPQLRINSNRTSNAFGVR